MKMAILLAPLSFLIALSLSVTGCASKPKVDWNGRIGNYTYDQAVIELGPPNRQSTLSDGRNVAEWVVGYSGGSGLSIGIGSFSGHTGIGVSQSMGSGGYERVVRLTFDAEGKLVEWKRN